MTKLAVVAMIIAAACLGFAGGVLVDTVIRPSVSNAPGVATVPPFSSAVALSETPVVAHPYISFRVNGTSMAPTLHNGELVTVDTSAYRRHGPQRGNVILFRFPLNPSQEFVKRVIGLPGERVQVRNRAVYVNGVRLQENYTAQPPNYTMLTIPSTNSNVIPKNDYFVLGDNRNDSYDSHLWGLLPQRDVIGKVLVPGR